MEYKLGWFSLIFGIIWLIVALVFAKAFKTVGVIGIGMLVFYICGVVFMFLGIFYLGVKYGIYNLKPRSKVPEDDDSNKIRVEK